MHSLRGSDPPPRIRPATLADLDDLLRLEQAFPGDRLSRRSFRHLLTKGNADVWVVGGETILAAAVVLYRKGSKRARLYSLVVQPEARGRGFGARLLEHVEAAVSRRGCVEIRLELREDNVAAFKLYEARGYTLLGRESAYYDDGAACLRMSKRTGELFETS